MEFSFKNIADYKSKQSLQLLTDLLSNVDKKRQSVILSHCFRDGLLVETNKLMRFARIILGKKKYPILIWALCEKDSDFANDSWKFLKHHILNGRDTVDPLSAGGFNGKEMDLFTGYLDDLKLVISDQTAILALRGDFFVDTPEVTKEDALSSFVDTLLTPV